MKTGFASPSVVLDELNENPLPPDPNEIPALEDGVADPNVNPELEGGALVPNVNPVSEDVAPDPDENNGFPPIFWS